MSEMENKRFQEPQWLEWAKELQFIAQVGLTYTKDPFDRERFERIRKIAAEMMSRRSGLPLETVKKLFCNETGFQTPKLDCRAAIFEEEKILLVLERDGRWALPGGWVDVNQTIRSNLIKEIQEEAGFKAKPVRLIALHDRNQHNQPPYAYNVCKVFILCEIEEKMMLNENIETVDRRVFSIEEIPQLAEEKCNVEQVRLCFEASRDPYWQPIFD